MMNARRWGMVEVYHQRRQGLQFQSLYQPGIVTGLGVRVVEPPESAGEGQSYPWIEIQPGVAIDLKGNPIIVAPLAPQNGEMTDDLTLKYPIQRKPPAGGSVTVYITLSHEPHADLPQPSREIIREWFRIDEITHPPREHQVELCRIQLTDPTQLADPELAHPKDVMAPGDNQLDFRYRVQAKIRPHAVVRAAQVIPAKNAEEFSDLATSSLYQRSRESLVELMDTVFSLYPSLRGCPEIPQIYLSDPLDNYDLLYLPDGEVLLQMSDRSLNILKQFVQIGGGLLIETSSDSEIDPILQRIASLMAESPNSTLQPWESLPDDPVSRRKHSLRRSPFLFGRLPNIQRKALQLYSSGSIVLLQGNLSSAWRVMDSELRPRLYIRTAQELGINILYYLWQRRQGTRLMNW